MNHINGLDIEKIRKGMPLTPVEMNFKTLMSTDTAGTFDSIERKMEKAEIGKRYRRCSFDSINPDALPEDIKKAYAAAKAYASNFPKMKKEGRGFILAGSVGKMKTTLAVCIARAVLEQGKSVYFISMAELLDRIVMMTKAKDNTEYQKFDSKIRHTSLLILDDAGMEYPSGWVLNNVDAIITNRYNEMMPVIITTNLMPEQMQGRYMQRVCDRLKQTSEMVVLSGESMRHPQGA